MVKRKDGEKVTARIFRSVRLPTESFGPCRTMSCKQFGVLADGLCVRCWDRKGEG